MKRTVFLGLLLIALITAFTASADIVEGTWFGQGSALGQATSVSCSFDGVGSFSASGLGRDVGGSYTISGDSVVLSAAGVTMALTFSSSGSSQNLSGSVTYRGITGSISLARDVVEPTPKDDGAAGEGGEGGEYEPDDGDRVIPGGIYAVWTYDDKISYSLSIYESGFAGLSVIDEAGADERLIERLGEYAPDEENVIADIMRDVQQNEPQVYEYPTRFEAKGGRITLTLLDDSDPLAFKSFFSNLYNAESRQFSFSYRLYGNFMAITGDNGKTLSLLASQPSSNAPVSEAFWRYVPVSNGDRGDNVALLQSRLIDMGLLTGKADGIFGNKTRNAVEALQKKSGLEVTGIADDKTWTALLGG